MTKCFKMFIKMFTRLSGMVLRGHRDHSLGPKLCCLTKRGFDALSILNTPSSLNTMHWTILKFIPTYMLTFISKLSIKTCHQIIKFMKKIKPFRPEFLENQEAIRSVYGLELNFCLNLVNFGLKLSDSDPKTQRL